VRGYRTAGFGALFAFAACFEPSYPVGLLCSPKGECPGDQICVDEVCVRSRPSQISDAGAGAADARLPIFYDATPCVATAADDATCDGVDDDCDGSFDEDAGGTATWYRDSDGDGHGLASAPVTACAQPPGTTDSADDCWDSQVEPVRSALAFPGQTDDQEGLMTESTTGLLGDWNCDGEIVYSEVLCSVSCAPHPACYYGDYTGWVNEFAECGESREYCYNYDPYKRYCSDHGLLAQRCL
jgi:hypothetical protein